MNASSTTTAASGTRLALAYPFRFEATEDFSDYHRDEAGVPTVYYRHLQRRVYNPITIAQFGLYQLYRFDRDGDVRAALQAQTMADWLVGNQEEWRQGIGAWIFRFDLPFYGPRQPWISALAQGQAISLLLRAAQLCNTAKYEAASRRAVRAFYHSVAEGGVVQRFPDGSPVFEEYPTVEPSMVLNGHLFAMLGLHDYAAYFDDATAAGLFVRCLTGLRANLMHYDTGYWNHYDLHRSRRLTSADYVRIHVQLLNILAAVSGEAFLAETAQRWQGYLDSPWCRARFWAGKVVEKLRLRLNNYMPPPHVLPQLE
ncbi:MAG: D-glucuronyl C5-epimerase family protein [candidate division KSB1 bacterium]|nr:D-glucuronyl C5-epimerase family protein [candidate division KSB1 bacterium]MDZ7276430.1 D-glucuronyl C5-epimerase family protein [candidate division KSB1 bacterium]MDZ7288100.1 D-glucuronyl C5-epimerase family protein [candidate division KSB1 bacterium]MDZ7300201.1 D-glucuronyl C5-epimerase family protein [candidate division KSB1 bacterium]MDZ7305772.1 D-glucuronyl C5-epimerase family protein [candidate division KSB1 bacterium]